MIHVDSLLAHAGSLWTATVQITTTEGKSRGSWSREFGSEADAVSWVRRVRATMKREG